MADGRIAVSSDQAYLKAKARWHESEDQRLLLEVKLEEVLVENERLNQENAELKSQIEEMIAVQSNGRSLKEIPEDALRQD